jgi:hypothetical protein
MEADDDNKNSIVLNKTPPQKTKAKVLAATVNDGSSLAQLEKLGKVLKKGGIGKLM